MWAACASPSAGACTVGTPIRRRSSRASATISLVKRDVIVAFEYARAMSPRASAALGDFLRLARRRRAVEDEREPDGMLGHEPCGPVEETRQMRRDASP